ncbi:unnamed protein product [Albugo candida]|uniref:UDP-N-acetylglucosamine--peptide N-acetylglucosaminyltransferase SPINDLY n=1 Tax=Albugo candida TaxID=65357 RepID=A0A024FVH4_9STRA|nr:unnamed protein product [Albugo candida]|eukprot:CCI10664.1 unnamed protein product [Albugo candida]
MVTKSGLLKESLTCYKRIASFRDTVTTRHIHFKLGMLYLLIEEYGSAYKELYQEVNESYGIIQEENESLVGSGSDSSVYLESRMQEAAIKACALKELEDIKKRFPKLLKENQIDFVGNDTHCIRAINLTVTAAMAFTYRRYGMLDRTEEVLSCCKQQFSLLSSAYYLELGFLSHARGDHSAAIAVFNQVMTHETKDSVLFNRAMIGAGLCSLHQGAFDVAGQAIHEAIRQLKTLYGKATSPTREVISISLFDALYLFAGLQMISRTLKPAVDAFMELIQLKYTSKERERFRAPTLLSVAEDGRSQYFTPLMLREAIRHLNEIETRYGPDVCLYLHRSNLYRALGDIELSVRDIALVEAMDSEYLATYHQADCRKELFDVNTISWIPKDLIYALDHSMRQDEYVIPRLVDTMPGEDKNQSVTAQENQQNKRHIFSEESIYRYFDERLLEDDSDTYAEICRLDIMRRRPLQRKTTKPSTDAEDLLWDGTILDQPYCSDEAANIMEALHSSCSKHDKDPYICMLLGIHALEMLDASSASHYFTKALTYLQAESIESISPLFYGCANTTTRIFLWKLVLPRMRYYCSIWLSLSRMLNNEIKSVTDEFNEFDSAYFSDGNKDNTLLFAQISIAKLMDGPLKFACKSLKECQSCISQIQKDRHGDAKHVTAYEITEIKDIFSNAGLKSFCLFPSISRSEFYEKLTHERFSPIQMLAKIDIYASERFLRRFSILHIIQLYECKEKIDAAKGTGYRRRPAIVAAHNEESHRLDQKFDEGVLKLAKLGNVTSGISIFDLILFSNKNYISGRSFSRSDFSQNKEHESPDSKSQMHHNRLLDRSKWLEQQVGWKFEALADLNHSLYHSPLNTDTSWSRFRLFKKVGNATAGLADANCCLQRFGSHIVWKNKFKPECRRPVFVNDTQRDQWLRLVFICGELNVELKNFGEAVSKFSSIKENHGGSQKVSLVKVLELRTKCYISLKDYSHAVADINELEDIRKLEKHRKLDATNSSVEKTLYFILVGTLHCKYVLDHRIFASAGQSNEICFAPWSLRSLTTITRQYDSIHLAMDAYQSAVEISGAHHLVRYLQGRMHAITGDSKSAIQRLTQSLAAYPSFPPALFLRGCVYLKEGLVTLALVDYHNVYQFKRSYPNIAISIAYCYYMQHKLDHVLEILTEAISFGDKNVEIHYLRGCALMKHLAINNAIKDFKRVLRTQPLHQRALFRLGVCHITAQRCQEARSILMQVTALEPKWFEAWRSLGYANMCLNQYEEAITSYTRSIELVGHTSSIRAASYLERAMAYFHLQTFTAALSDLNQAVKFDSLQFLVLIMELMIYSILNDKENKRHAINKWISRCQESDEVASLKWIIKGYEFTPTYSFLCQHSKKITTLSTRSLQPARSRYPRLDGKRIGSISSLMQAKWHLFFRILVANYRSLKALESMKVETPQCDNEIAKIVQKLRISDTAVIKTRRNCEIALILWVYNSIGISSLADGMVEEAIRAYTRAIDNDSENAILYYNRSQAYARNQRPESAISDLQIAIRIHCRCFQAQNNLGIALLKSKQIGDARDAFVAGLVIAVNEKDRAIIMYNLGTICHSLEQHVEALQYYEQAIKMDSSRYEFFFNRGSIFHSQEFYKEALEDYNRVLTILRSSENDATFTSPDLSSVYVNRAQSYVSLGLCSEAIEDLMTAHRTLKSSKVQQARTRPTFAPNDTRKRTSHFDTNECVASKLWTFCVQWKQALRIATNDFLFSFSCIPCYNFSEIYQSFSSRLADSNRGQHDTIIDSIDREKEFQIDSSDLKRLQPFQDESFFQFEQYVSPNDYTNSTIIHYFPLIGQTEVKNAVKYCLNGEYTTALYHLLRAHYFCPRDSHAEYLLLMWRVQVMQKVACQEKAKNFRAIELLSTFLEDREHFDSTQVNEASDNDEMLQKTEDWLIQRSVIRADMYSYLGCLHLLDGSVKLAKKSFNAAIQNRPDYVIAFFNLIILSLDLEKYDDVLHRILQVLQLSIAFCDKKAKSNETLGLMYEDRSIKIIAPTIVAYFLQSDTLPLINELVRALERYRRQLTAKKIFDTEQIFEVQGLIAVITEKIIYLEKTRTVPSHFAEDNSIPFSHKLQKLTRNVREYTERFLYHSKSTNHSEDSLFSLDNEFDTELDKLYCEIESALSIS